MFAPRTSPRHRATLLGLTTAALFAFPEMSWGDVTSIPIPEQPGGLIIQPVISQSGVWDTNPLLSVTGAQQLYGSITSPELIITDNTPLKQFKFDTQINENVFNISDFDSTDLHSKDSFTTQNQNWMAGLVGQLDYDTTRTSEVSTYGIQTAPVRHLGVAAMPQVTYSPVPTDKLGLAASAATSQYATSAYSDYNVFSATPSYTHNFDPLNSGLINLTAQHYETTTGPRNTTDTIGPSIGWISNLTPRLSVNATVGTELMRQDQAGIASQPWTAQYIFSADLTFKGQQDTVDVIASRAAFPFGNGTESLLTSFSATDTHQLNDNFSFNVGASYEDALYQVSSVDDLQSLATATGGLTYHATEHIDITTTYQYRYETLIDVHGGVDDHSVNIGLVYHPKAWTL